ncbi:MAG: hypothetical protein M0P39_03440 [Rhodocyclaceae bacterium]|jgi:hypothetical protein|nr:hypothetical protein [Rhodocyclaceae bacterium]
MGIWRQRWHWSIWLVLLVGGGLFSFSVERLGGYPRKFPDPEIQVTLPRFVQVALAGGDRYLAANIAVVRSLLNSFGGDTRDRYLVQARVQTDAAWLNPRHEDNYYVAAALLSWSGYVPEAEDILLKASQARPFDMLPPLYLGFDYFYFNRDSVLGSRWMYEAARRADSEQNRISLTRIASRWAERGQDARDALRMVEVMIQQARGASLKRYLELRAERLRGLVQLQEAAGSYRERNGKSPASLEDLVRSGIVKKLPVDPQGRGYGMDAEGMPMLIQDPIRGPAGG